MLCENATLGGNGKLWQIADLYKSNLALTGIRFLSLLIIWIISPTFLHTTYVTSSIKVIIKAYTFDLNGLSVPLFCHTCPDQYPDQCPRNCQCTLEYSSPFRESRCGRATITSIFITRQTGFLQLVHFLALN